RNWRNKDGCRHKESIQQVKFSRKKCSHGASSRESDFMTEGGNGSTLFFVRQDRLRILAVGNELADRLKTFKTM
ncbi:unnamed protein product, partial [Larinioides sclopetarius]